MRAVDLTKKQSSFVDCPICGVAAGRRCLVEAGGPRVEPHMSRKLAVIEVLERKRKSPRSKKSPHRR
jgi:hypothetical protein